MEKEQILSEMVAKLGKTSLSQRTISGYVEGNLPTDGVEPDDAYWQKHVGFLKSLDGNFSHDVAHAVDEFKKSYKADGTDSGDRGTKGGSNDDSGNAGSHEDALLKRLKPWKNGSRNRKTRQRRSVCARKCRTRPKA